MQIKNYARTLSPNEDYTFVRASISDKCHMDCVYCPKSDGMENIVPEFLQGKYLALDDYTNNLIHIRRNGIEGISFTGGEPTLNANLSEYLKFAKETFNRVELNTNGYKLSDHIDSIVKHVDLLKISLDTTNPKDLRKITNGRPYEFFDIVSAINIACKAGVNIAINSVLFKSNIDQLNPIIELCRTFNKTNKKNVYISFLDLYYTYDRRDFFLNEYLSLSEIANDLTKEYGEPYKQDRHGCIFYWFNANGIAVRLKDSNSLTYRAKVCNTCDVYCQEGIYSLKHSVEGWVTTCPSRDIKMGTYLYGGITNEEANEKLSPIVKNLKNSKPDFDSYKTFCLKNNIFKQDN